MALWAIRRGFMLRVSIRDLYGDCLISFVGFDRTHGAAFFPEYCMHETARRRFVAI